MKTTTKDFSYFKKRCQHWIDFFGLKQWKVYYVHEEDNDHLATINTKYEGKVATVFLSTNWNVKPTKESLDFSAFHEVCEILLSPLFGLAETRTWDKSEYESRHHEVIRTLENIILK